MTEKKTAQVAVKTKPPVVSKPKRSKWWGCCIGCGIVAFIVVTAFLIIFFLWVKAVAKQVAKGGQSPVTLLQMARSMTPSDYGTLKRFATKIENGQIVLTDQQETEASALINRMSSSKTMDRQMAAQAAQMLKSLDPEDFEDTNHWTDVLYSILPFFTILGNVTPTGIPGPTGIPNGFNNLH